MSFLLTVPVRIYTQLLIVELIKQYKYKVRKRPWYLGPRPRRSVRPSAALAAMTTGARKFLARGTCALRRPERGPRSGEISATSPARFTQPRGTIAGSRRREWNYTAVTNARATAAAADRANIM